LTVIERQFSQVDNVIIVPCWFTTNM